MGPPLQAGKVEKRIKQGNAKHRREAALRTSWHQREPEGNFPVSTLNGLPGLLSERVLPPDGWCCVGSQAAWGACPWL